MWERSLLVMGLIFSLCFRDRDTSCGGTLEFMFVSAESGDDDR